MSIKKTISKSEFIDEFKETSREEQFTHEAKEALFDHLEEYSETCNIDIELDIIAICCEYAEYKNLKEFQKDYSEEYETIEDIAATTTIILLESEAFIIRSF